MYSGGTSRNHKAQRQRRHIFLGVVFHERDHKGLSRRHIVICFNAVVSQNLCQRQSSAIFIFRKQILHLLHLASQRLQTGPFLQMSSQPGPSQKLFVLIPQWLHFLIDACAGSSPASPSAPGGASTGIASSHVRWLVVLLFFGRHVIVDILQSAELTTLQMMIPSSSTLEFSNSTSMACVRIFQLLHSMRHFAAVCFYFSRCAAHQNLTFLSEKKLFGACDPPVVSSVP